MIMSVRVCGLCLLLALAACAQPPAGDHAAPAARAAKPPADYVYIAGAEGSDTKESTIFVEPGLLSESAKGDGKLTVFFGLYFLGAVRDAQPAHPGVTGDGSRVDRPITFDPPVAGQQELDMTMNELAGRHPDRNDVKGSLYRTPTGRYLLYAEFETGAGPRALYYDVTNWAAYQSAKTY
jgi:hypothetical protein